MNFIKLDIHSVRSYPKLNALIFIPLTAQWHIGTKTHNGYRLVAGDSEMKQGHNGKKVSNVKAVGCRVKSSIHCAIGWNLRIFYSI